MAYTKTDGIKDAFSTYTGTQFHLTTCVQSSLWPLRVRVGRAGLAAIPACRLVGVHAFGFNVLHTFTRLI